MSLPPKSSRLFLAAKKQRVDLRTSAQLREDSSATANSQQPRQPANAATKPPLEAVLVGVPVSQTDADITDLLKAKLASVSSARRILKFPRQEPTSFISVRFSDTKEAADVLKNGVTLNEEHYHAEPPRRRRRLPNIARCFHCQELTTAHVSRTCPNKRRCPRCSEDHEESACQAADPKCANCNQEHPAFSSQCPAWLHLRTKAARQSTPACSQDVHDLRSDCKRIFQVVEGNNRYLKTHHELFKDLLGILNTQAAELVELRRLVTPPTETLREDDSQPEETTSFNTTTDLVGDVVLDTSTEDPAPSSEEDDLPPLEDTILEDLIEDLLAPQHKAMFSCYHQSEKFDPSKPDDDPLRILAQYDHGELASIVTSCLTEVSAEKYKADKGKYKKRGKRH